MTRPDLPLRRALLDAADLPGGALPLDGGLSNRLEEQGCDLGGELWSARLLADAPEQIGAAHSAYVRAGARVVITASYQASFEGFARLGAGGQRAGELFRRSVTVARQAADAGDQPVWVAASVGPYGAVRADGGEYRGRYGLSVAELAEFHRPRMEALAQAGPDALALETVPDTDEAEAMLRAARGCGLPLWLSYTVADGRTRAGQPLDAAYALAADDPLVVAVGVNCSAAREVPHAVRTAVYQTGKPAVAYPNSGEGWDSVNRRWCGESTFTPAQAAGWAADGARLIGGCCRVGPAQVARLADELRPR